MANAAQQGTAPLTNWAKMRSDPAYRKRSAARAKLIAATSPNNRYTPPINQPITLLVQGADLDVRKDKQTGEVYGESVWVQLAVAQADHPDNKRQFRYYMDLPRFTKKKDGSDSTYDFGTACIKAFLMAFQVDEETASDENAWPELFGATIGHAIQATPRLKHSKPYEAKKANPNKGINVGDPVTPPARLYLDNITETVLPEGGDFPTVADDYASDDGYVEDAEGVDGELTEEAVTQPLPAQSQVSRPAPRRPAAVKR